MMPKTIKLASDETLRTLQKDNQQQAYLLSESFDGKRAFKPSPIVSFGVLFRLEQLSLTRTVGSTEYKGHLQ